MRRRRCDSAEEWLAYLLRGEVTRGDLEDLEAWCARSPENRADFDALQRGWQLAGELEGDADLAAAMISHPNPGPSRSASRRSAWRGGLLAAAAVTATVGALWVVRSQDQVLQHRTVQGEQRTVALVDGSRVHLNTATTLNVAADGHQVKLLAGEAFFDVRSRQSSHFSVDAGAGTIRVLGTRFNVLRKGDGVVISVLEGRVAVETGGAGEASSHRLGVGQTLEIRDTGKPRMLTGGGDLARVQAWQEGKVEFDRTPLVEAVRELSRYTPEVLTVAEPGLGELRISGVFLIERLNDLGSVRFALENTLPVKIRAAGDAFELVPSGD